MALGGIPPTIDVRLPLGDMYQCVVGDAPLSMCSRRFLLNGTPVVNE